MEVASAFTEARQLGANPLAIEVLEAVLKSTRADHSRGLEYLGRSPHAKEIVNVRRDVVCDAGVRFLRTVRGTRPEIFSA